MLEKLRKWLAGPFGIMTLVALMYVVKSAAKLLIAARINSPMIAADGVHNISDFFEALVVIAVIFVAKLPASREYPFGRKNIEFFSSLLIGLALLVLSAKFAIQSVAGLLSFFPVAEQATRTWLPFLPVHEALVMDSGAFPWVLAVTIGSCLLSAFMGRLQISTGKRTGHTSLVADGQETLSDGRIELVTIVGVLAEYALHAPWLEYPLAMFVAVLIGRTGYELFSSAWRVLLQHSIGAEHESAIRSLCLRVSGVDGITQLKSFQVGQTAVCMVTVTTAHNSQTNAHIKYGIEYALAKYLLENGFHESELNVRFEKPEPRRHRIAYALVKNDSGAAIAASIDEATHILICDVEHGAVVRTKEEKKPDDPAAMLAVKRVRTLYVFGSQPPRQLLGASTLAATSSYMLSVHGLTEEQ